ncbi:MAG: hypothetical protein WBC44_18720 [Planctomycetaceae bacterium]
MSLRPRADAPTVPLPRTVLRHLVSAGGLGIGSRVLVAGDAAASAAAFLEYLGMDVAVADAGPSDDPHDAVIWLDRNQARPGERSLISPTAIERTARLVNAVRPQGTFLLVNHLGRMTGGHAPECLEQHVAVLPGQAEFAVIPERPFLGFLRENARPAYAIAAWKAPGKPLSPADWRRRIAAVTAFSTSCCRWAEETALSRRVA